MEQSFQARKPRSTLMPYFTLRGLPAPAGRCAGYRHDGCGKAVGACVVASDAGAIESNPALRATATGNVVNYDDIIDALQSLDDGQSADTVTYAFKPAAAQTLERLERPWTRRARQRRRRLQRVRLSRLWMGAQGSRAAFAAHRFSGGDRLPACEIYVVRHGNWPLGCSAGAFSRTGDPATGDLGDATVIRNATFRMTLSAP
jgi:hypothetical protein